MKKVLKQVRDKLKKGRKAVSGFTLIEMLAAIGVAGILGGIVTPAAINSLAKSRQAKCAENLRQFGTALVQYVNDTGVYPPSAVDVTGDAGMEVRQRWFNILSPYMGADERARTNAQGATGTSNNLGDLDQSVFTRAFICPEVEGEWKIGRNNSYGYNHQYLGNARSTDPLVDTTRTAGRKKNGRVNFPVTMADLKDPTRTIAIADTDGTGHLGPYRDPTTMISGESTGGALTFSATGNGQDSWSAGSIIANRLSTLGNEGYQIDPTFLPCRNLTDPTNDTTFDAPDDICGAAGGSSRHCQAARGVVSNRHDGGANVCFADGHVEYFTREAVYIHPTTGRPSNRLWNGYGRDNDEDGNGIVALNDPIYDSNEWICDLNGNGIADAGEANTVIGSDIDGPLGGWMGEDNSGFLLGSNELNSATEIVNARGGMAEEALVLDKDGPTIPKRVPFPLIATVLAQSE
ncbi:MAG: DUF1559 domain-containing protein [wastewater metagenome]|nr:DUF1559 domain-containing protein [Candidatus Loosdrechtia aerotolerans]